MIYFLLKQKITRIETEQINQEKEQKRKDRANKIKDD